MIMANYEEYHKGYADLSVGVIEFALDDYASTVKSLSRYHAKLVKYLDDTEKAKTRYQRIGDICQDIYKRIWNMHDIETFLQSKWAKSLTSLDVDYLFSKLKKNLKKKGYKVGIMGMIVTTDDKGVKVYAKEREGANGKFMSYSVGVSSKSQSGEWVNGYVNCKFKKGVTVANKTKIKIKNSFFIVTKSGDKTYTQLMITEFDVLEPGETAAQDADEFIKIDDKAKELEDEMPFL